MKNAPANFFSSILKKRNLGKYSFFKLIVMLCICFVFCSCRKELRPSSITPDAKINFYNASVTFLTAEYSVKYIYLDKADTNTVNTPAFFPSGYSEFPVPPGVIAPNAQTPVTYMRMSTGSHDVRFTNNLMHATVYEKAFQLKHDQPLCLYLADSVENYTVLPVYETQISNPTKVRVRFINLSPDADSLNCHLELKDGKQAIVTGLPQNFRYKSYTPYIEIDTTTNTLRGNLFFSFAAKKDTLNGGTTAPINAFVPAQPGRSYTVLIQGYKYGVTYSKADGTSVTVPVNVQTVVRANY